MKISVTSSDELKAMIASLEVKKQMQELELKQSIKEAMNNLKPANLVKAAFHKVATSPDLQENLIDSSIGMAAGFLTKKILVGKSRNPIKKLMGSVAQYGITNLVSQHSGGIKSVGARLLRMVIKKKEKKYPTAPSYFD